MNDLKTRVHDILANQDVTDDVLFAAVDETRGKHCHAWRMITVTHYICDDCGNDAFTNGVPAGAFDSPSTDYRKPNNWWPLAHERKFSVCPIVDGKNEIKGWLICGPELFRYEYWKDAVHCAVLLAYLKIWEENNG